jgi:hypothetical protein
MDGKHQGSGAQAAFVRASESCPRLDKGARIHSRQFVLRHEIAQLQGLLSDESYPDFRLSAELYLGQVRAVAQRKCVNYSLVMHRQLKTPKCRPGSFQPVFVLHPASVQYDDTAAGNTLRHHHCLDCPSGPTIDSE